MKLIPLTRGLFAKVSDRDYPRLRKFKWYAFKGRSGFYAARTVKMHGIILDSIGVDHKNHDTLDNQRSNIRRCSNTENQANSRRRKNSSGFRGVSWNRLNKKWYAEISCGRHRTWLGAFSDPISAAKRYDSAAQRLFGRFATLNFPEKTTKTKTKK